MAVAPRNASARADARGPFRGLGAGLLLAGLLLASLSAACGAEANDAAEGPGGGEPRPPSGAVTAAAAATEAGEVSPEAAGVDASGGGLSSATTSPLLPATEPPPSTPPPVARPVESSRPLLPPAPGHVVVPPGDCRFDYLGVWVRCENAGWPNVVESVASDLVGCMQECLGRDDCTAVTDYFWLGLPELGCYLYLASCDAPSFAESWGEEDGGREFRRNCAPGVDPEP